MKKGKKENRALEFMKKVGIGLIALVMMFLVGEESVKASSYPFIFSGEETLLVEQGEELSIEFTVWNGDYKYERYQVYVYSGTIENESRLIVLRLSQLDLILA